MLIKKILHELNIVAQCRRMRVSIWSCPQFIFIVMGIVIIATILVTFNVAQRYAEIEVVVAIIIFLTVFLFIVSYVVVRSFEQVVTVSQLNYEHAQKIIKLKDQFVFIAAHELKTPVTALTWSLNELESEKNILTKEEKSRLIQGMRETSKRLGVLIKDILQTARLDGQIGETPLEPVGIHEMFRETHEDLRSLIEEHKVKFTNNLPSDLPQVLGNPSRVKEVMSNLVSNAIKYSDPSHGEVVIEATEKENRVIIGVSNNGQGISDRDKPYIFQKFWRSPSTKEKVEGTGLGLFLVKQLITLMNGEVWFDSMKGKTTFYFSLVKADKPRF